MPVTPIFDWEQSLLDVTVRATIKGFKADAIDVFISDVFVKVNAAPTYLLALDLLHPIIVEKSSFRIEGQIVKITLPKATEQIWDTLCIDRRTFFLSPEERRAKEENEKKDEKSQATAAAAATKAKLNTTEAGATEESRVEELPSDEDEAEAEANKKGDDAASETKYNVEDEDEEDSINRPKTLNDRRRAAIRRAEALYNTRLDSRERQKAVEKKRMHSEQWELERQQRQAIIDKVAKEKAEEQQRLYEWEETEKAKTAAKNLKSPADIAMLAAAASASSSSTPAVRNVGETANFTINFTPKSLTAPTRSRGDEDYYRRSKYRPVSVEDSPMFWKERADKAYRARDFRAAAEAYTESIKRDGVFLSCVANRAACRIQLHEYAKAIDDCDLALTLLANTPASDTTQQRYKAQMCKLHARRGAAKCWAGQHAAGLEDLRLAVAYRSTDGSPDGGTDASGNPSYSPEAAADAALVSDVATLEAYMQRMGIATEAAADPNAQLSSHAAQLYYAGRYEEAIAAYRDLLALDPFAVKARSNMAAAMLQLGQFKDAAAECAQVIEFCGEVARALKEPGATSSAAMGDSDDEDEAEGGGEVDEMVKRKSEAARKIGEKSGHVYLLLKAYVRMAAAHCGLKDYRAAFEFMEMAVRITPYDDDLRDDANKMLEKLKFATLISASGGAGAAGAGAGGGASTSAGAGSLCADGSCTVQH